MDRLSEEGQLEAKFQLVGLVKQRLAVRHKDPGPRIIFRFCQETVEAWDRIPKGPLPIPGYSILYGCGYPRYGLLYGFKQTGV